MPVTCMSRHTTRPEVHAGARGAAHSCRAVHAGAEGRAAESLAL